MQVKLKNIILAHLDLVIVFAIINTAIALFVLLNNFLLIENTILIILIQQIIFVLPIMYFGLKNKITLKQLGFNYYPLTKSILLVLVGFFSITIFNALFLLITQHFNLEVPGFGEQQDYLPLFQNSNLVITYILITLIVPIVEELLFRGLIFKLTPFSTTYKVLFNGLLFSLIHFQFEVIIPLFMLGVIITLIRVKAKSIYPAILFHIINNNLAFSLEFFQ